MRTLVAPPSAVPRVLPLFSPTGWDLEAAPPGDAAEPQVALGLAGPGQVLVFVRPGASVPASLRRVVVLHDGTLASSPAVQAADRLATSTGAELVVVHLAELDPPTDPGSLTAPRVRITVPMTCRSGVKSSCAGSVPCRRACR
jgi:hypothetical protein